MATFLTLPELALWSQSDEAEVIADPYAQAVIDAACQLVEGEIPVTAPGYDSTTVPFTAKRIALLVARRTYLNPDMERTYHTGPIGGSVMDAAALGMTLSEAEKNDLHELAPDGGEDGLWIQPTNQTRATEPVVFLMDDSGSDWAIPYADFNESDFFNEPGDVFI